MKAPKYRIDLGSEIIFFFFLLFFTGIPQFTIAQNCQGSYDHIDIYGEDFEEREFRCGYSMEREKRYGQRKNRESQGYYEISGLPYYSNTAYYEKEGLLYFAAKQDSFVLVENADLKSIQIKEAFLLDNKHVYMNGKSVSDLDIQSFKPIKETNYAKDKNKVYYTESPNGISYTDGIRIVESANPKTFKVLLDESYYNGYDYAKDDKQVYYKGQLVEGADPDSFKLGEYGFAVDRESVFYSGQKMAGSSARSFEILEFPYAKDENQAYYYGAVIPGMVGKNFSVIEMSGIGTDGVHLCYSGQLLAESDARTFVDLGCGYYKDAGYVYTKGMILEGADAPTFEVIEWGFTRDKNSVYCDDVVIPGADPNTFEVLSRKYGKDSANIYYLRIRLHDADYASFKADAANPNLGEDASSKFERGMRVPK